MVGKFLSVEAQIGHLRHFSFSGEVIEQTRNLCGVETARGRQSVSLFEPHTEVIRKGKARKPNEFGRLVRMTRSKRHRRAATEF